MGGGYGYHGNITMQYAPSAVDGKFVLYVHYVAVLLVRILIAMVTVCT